MCSQSQHPLIALDQSKDSLFEKQQQQTQLYSMHALDTKKHELIIDKLLTACWQISATMF